MNRKFNNVFLIFSFETENGIYASESGKPVEGYGDEESYDVNGQFSYTGPDGVVYKVVYVADANGFQPQGAHLPTLCPLSTRPRRRLMMTMMRSATRRLRKMMMTKCPPPTTSRSLSMSASSSATGPATSKR